MTLGLLALEFQTANRLLAVRDFTVDFRVTE
jgi:hypothetical protein